MPRALLITFLLALVAAVPGAVAQNSDCPQGPPLLTPSDPIYPEAMDLARQLEAHGFEIRCMFPSKAGSIFEIWENGVLRPTIEGETCFRTNFGEFNVFFVPKPQTFANLQIAEKKKDGGYLYRFTGTPRVWAGDKFKFGTARRQLFLKRENQLFLVAYDGDLRVRLTEALHFLP